MKKSLKKPNTEKKSRKKAASKPASSGAVLTIKREDLLQALKVADGVVEKRATMPVLGHVLIDAGKKKCTLSATDIETHWTKSLKCEAAGAVSACVPLAVLLKEVQALHDIEDVVLSFGVETVSVNGRASIYTMPSAEFPTAPELKDGLETDIADLVTKFRRVVPAAGDSDTRYTLNTVLVDFECGKIVASDGHRMHIEDGATVPDVGAVLIPRRAVLLAIRHEASSGIKVSKTHVSLDLAGGSLVTRRVEGTYPRYSEVFPKDNAIKVSFLGTELLKVFEGALPLSNGSNAVKLVINGAIKVESLNPDLGSYSYEVPCETVGNGGKDMEFGFNAGYLIDAIKAFTTKDDDSVVMEFGGDPLTPCIINNRAVVMPMRI